MRIPGQILALGLVLSLPVRSWAELAPPPERPPLVFGGDVPRLERVPETDADVARAKLDGAAAGERAGLGGALLGGLVSGVFLTWVGMLCAPLVESRSSVPLEYMPVGLGPRALTAFSAAYEDRVQSRRGWAAFGGATAGTVLAYALLIGFLLIPSGHR